jgi:HD-GYP domain-containing protein (c-di-GMP phosphodiesterase class II)/putative methionine-R-sulfoxide reductase with GAF domain
MEKYVLEKRAPLILSDAQVDPRFHTFEASQTIRGWMGLPLTAHEKVIGFLAIASNEPDSYGAVHAELAMAFANQAATAIENASLFQDAVQYAQRWATLHALSQELARVGEDLDQVYFSIHNAVAKLLPTEVFTITLTDDKHTSLDTVYLFNRGLRHPAMKTPFGKGLSSEVISSGVSIKIDDDLENRPADAVKFGAPDMARSILAVPLRAGDKVIGAMSVQNYEPNAYSSEDRLLLELLATQAAIAIENTRLVEETLRKAQEFKALNETTRDMSTQQNNESLLQIIVERATELLHCTIGGFYLYDDEHQEMVSSFATSTILHTGTRLKVGEGAVGRVALTREPILLADYQKWEGRPGRFEGIPFRAVLGVPVLYGGELIGVLEVREYGESTRSFTQNDATLLSLFAAHAASVLHNARLHARLKERIEQFSTLHSIDLVIGSSTDLRVSLQVVLESIIHLLKIDAARILLYRPATFNLVYADSIGFDSEFAGSFGGLGEDLASHAAATRQMIDIPELVKVELPPPFRDMIDREGFTSYRCLPLIAKGEVKGVLELYHRFMLPSNPEWNDLLNLLAGQAAIAIDNAMLFSNLERANTELELAYDATIEGWSQALELRDHDTSGHTRRLLDTTITLARKMGIPDSELLNLRRGVLLHDIGKMGVPDQILLKPGPLNEEEWKIMRQHPLKAYDLLSKIAYLRPALDIPYYHHEKWDGSGYPRGLKGEQIPVSARIFSVVDVYDALSYDRPYRSAWPKDKVIEHIKEQSGKYFDPRVVEAFLKMIDSE